MANEKYNVQFLRGPSTNLPAAGAAKSGAFYLTNDTDRLYFGDEAKNLVEINRYIKQVADTSKLPADSELYDFVWVQTGNMLLVCTNTELTGVARWTQINAPDTNDDTKVSGISDMSVTSDATGVTVSFNINQKTSHKGNTGDTNATSIPVSFKISASDFATANKVAVDVGATAVDQGAKIATKGAGSAGTGFNLKGGSNVSVSVDDSNNITIAATDTQYTLGASENKLNLITSSGTDSVSLSSDNDAIAVTANADTVLVTHKEYATTEETSSETIASKGTFEVIDSITTDKGHVTGFNTKTVTLPGDNDTQYSVKTIKGDNLGKLTVALQATLNGANAGTPTLTSGQDFFYKVNGNNVYNQGTIEFYTKNEIDEKLNGVNAMVYKGTVDGTHDLPEANVAVGDTYMVAEKGTYGSHTCDVGDLLIATGTEANGVISGTITWTYVPAGDDTDTHYSLGVASNKITLTGNPGGEAGSVTIDAGQNIGVNTSGSTITVKHADITTTKTATNTTATPTSGGTVEVLDSITVENGHVTGYTNKTITLPAEIDTKSSLSVTSDNKIKLSETNGDHTEVALKNSDNILTLTPDTTAKSITINHKAYGAPTAEAGSALTPAHGDNFTIISGITTEKGHVTKYTTQQVTLPSDHDTKYSLAGETTVASNKATYTSTLTATGGDTTTSVLNITSSNLTVASSTANTVSIDLVWGSF